MSVDYYKILGVSKDVSQEEIKKAYRRLALEHHPDRNPDNKAKSEEQFKKISEAYAVVGDPEKRKAYDNPQSGFSFSNSDFGFSGFDDFMGSFFNVGHNHRRGSDIKFGVEITLEEVASGCERQISFSRIEQCNDCKGQGGSGTTCRNCNGYGKIRHEQGFMSMVSDCSVCHGRGMRITKTCNKCKGKGFETHPHIKSVKIPPGIDDGQGLRIRGEGNQENIQLPRGDLLVFVRVYKHSVYERQGQDLACSIEVSFPHLCLGDTATVRTIYGKEIEVTIPAGTSAGQMFRLKGHGLPKDHSKGDLYVSAKLKVPQKLSERAKELLVELETEIGI